VQNIKPIIWLVILGITGFVLYTVSSILAPFIASLVIAYFLNPLTLKLEGMGVKRDWTVTIIVGFFITALLVGIIQLIPALFEQIQQFISSIPEYEKYVATKVLVKVDAFIAKIDPKLAEEMHTQLSSFSAKFFGYVIAVIRGIFNSSLALFNIVGLLFFTPILVFYLLRDWEYVVKAVDKLLPLSSKKLILKQFEEIDLAMSAYVRGQINVCLILSAFYSISLGVIGLNYALLVGIISGFLVIIPYIGVVIGGSICALVAVLQFEQMHQIYLTLAIFVVGHLVESAIITPKLVGDKVGLHPVWIIFALMAGGVLFGFWGMFFAIPMAAILAVIIRSALKIYFSSQLYKSGKLTSK
jgi:predicted PurR-regulated permease PerM